MNHAFSCEDPQVSCHHYLDHMLTSSLALSLSLSISTSYLAPSQTLQHAGCWRMSQGMDQFVQACCLQEHVPVRAAVV